MKRTLRNTIKNIRLEKKMSLRQFSDCVGISHSYINKIENNPDIQNQATIETLLKISQALEIPFQDFLYMCGYFEHKSNTNTVSKTDSTHKRKLDTKLHFEKLIFALKNADMVTYGENILEQKEIDTIIPALKLGLEMAKQNSIKKIKPKD